MKLLFVMLLAVAAGISGAEISAYDVTPADKAFLSEVLAAVEKKDAAWIASHTLLPVAVGSGKEKEFRAIVARSLSPELAHRMRADAKGNGILWFTEDRKSDKDTWRYVILALGNFAFRPADEKG